MSITLKLNSVANQHDRISSISRLESGDTKYVVSMRGVWDYSNLAHRNPSGGLSNIHSGINFYFTQSQTFEDSFLWIDKFKSSLSNSFISEIGASIFINEKEFIFISQIASSKLTITILLDIDIILFESSEAEFQKILHEFNTKQKKIKKEYKILSYSISNNIEFIDQMDLL
jgi:hypothetical protein